MAALVSLYAARCANQNPEVKAFRSAVLGGDLLSPGMLEEASRSGPLSLPGALAEADRLAATLSEAYGWDVEGARRFLLTGESPRFSPLTVEVTKKGSSREAPTEIRIVALAGTPARYVTSAYRWEQHKLLGKKDSRPLSEKGIELYEFVVDEEARAAAEGRELSHRELMDEWQRRHEHHPGYIYGDPRRFGRALRRVEGVARRHAGMGFLEEPMPERE